MVNNFSKWPLFTIEEVDAVKDVLLSNKVNYWTGNECRKFEKEFSEFSDVDLSSQNITPVTIRSVITNKTKAIVCLHLADKLGCLGKNLLWIDSLSKDKMPSVFQQQTYLFLQLFQLKSLKQILPIKFLMAWLQVAVLRSIIKGGLKN